MFARSRALLPHLLPTALAWRLPGHCIKTALKDAHSTPPRRHGPLVPGRPSSLWGETVPKSSPFHTCSLTNLFYDPVLRQCERNAYCQPWSVPSAPGVSTHMSQTASRNDGLALHHSTCFFLVPQGRPLRSRPPRGPHLPQHPFVLPTRPWFGAAPPPPAVRRVSGWPPRQRPPPAALSTPSRPRPTRDLALVQEEVTKAWD